MLPNDFIENLKRDYAQQSDAIVQAITETNSPISIRYNRNKYGNAEIVEPIKWNSFGTYLFERPIFTLDPSFHAGQYYVQEASSMFLGEVLNQLDINSPLKVLDLCAAPGGKSTLMLDYLGEDDFLVSNEIIKNRANILKENIIKWGRVNCVVTNNEPKDFSNLYNYFDVIVVDAPCSGEGMFRKDKDAIKEWSNENVEKCYVRQQEIIDAVIPSLKENGYLIYSTCTYNRKENIDNVSQFCTQQEMTSIQLTVSDFEGIQEVKNEKIFGYQFLPNRLKGEGFFISVMQKKMTDSKPIYKSKKQTLNALSKNEKDILSKWIHSATASIYKNHLGDVYAYNQTLGAEINFLLENLRVVYSGVKCGNINKEVFIPDHALALSDLVKEDIIKIELSKQDALKFLNKTLTNIDSPKNGWHLATYENLGLGWIKNMGNRINNYFPVEWRIRMDIKD